MKAFHARFSISLVLSLVFAAALLTGCQDKSKTAAATPEQPELGKEVDLDKLPTLEVPDDGIEFDPSVPVAQLPEGAWTCDMGGLSHYAAMHKKDGKCPICHMDLVEVKAGEE